MAIKVLYLWDQNFGLYIYIAEACMQLQASQLTVKENDFKNVDLRPLYVYYNSPKKYKTNIAFTTL